MTVPLKKPKNVGVDKTALIESSEETVSHGTVPFALPGLSRGPMPEVLKPRENTEPHTESPRGPVNVRKLDADSVIKIVQSSKYLKGKLDSSTPSQQRLDAPEKMVTRVRKVVEESIAMFGDEPDADAMSIAIAIDKVAAVVASELYDPTLRPQIADDLFNVYSGTLLTAMKKRKVDAPDDQLALAKVIAAADPVSLFMHGEKRLEDASFEISEAAAAAKKTPLEMYTLYRRRFEADMASHSVESIKAQQHSAAAYNLSESTGELSTNYFTRLFGDTTGNGGKAKKKKGGKGLEFSPAATTQLEKLKTEVLAKKPDTRPKTAGERRKQLFDDVKTSDDEIKDMRERHVLEALKGAPWKLGDEKAKAVIAKLRAPTGLDAIPLTITHWSGRRTAGKDGNFDSKDKSRAGETTQVKTAEVIGKKHTKAKKALGQGERSTAGKYTDIMYGEERGERYMQFRKWKDSIMTGNLGMSGEEMPVFGAVNTNFDAHGGTSALPTAKVKEAHDKLASKKKRTPQETTLMEQLAGEHKRLKELPEDDQYGINYYGDMHLKLNRERIKDRVLYTATDHGQPHRDPFLAFADLLVGSVNNTETGETYHSDRTGLKRGTEDKPTKGTQKGGDAAAVIATILGVREQANLELPFEIQIFGGVDWETDVEEIWISPGAPKDAYDRLVKWQTADTKRPPVKKMVKPKGVQIVMAGGLQKKAIEAAKNLP